MKKLTSVVGTITLVVAGVCLLLFAARFIDGAILQPIFFNSYRNPTRTPAPRSTVTRRAPVTVHPTRTERPCLKWDQVIPSMEGREICVYGDVNAVYATGETWTRIRFTDQPNQFFLFSSNYTFDELTSGSCVVAYGKVELYEKTPFISIGEDLYHCEDWME